MKKTKNNKQFLIKYNLIFYKQKNSKKDENKKHYH